MAGSAYCVSELKVKVEVQVQRVSGAQSSDQVGLAQLCFKVDSRHNAQLPQRIFLADSEPVEQGPAPAGKADPRSDGRTRGCMEGVDHDDIHRQMAPRNGR
jgi:hypothetical protein